MSFCRFCELGLTIDELSLQQVMGTNSSCKLPQKETQQCCRKPNQLKHKPGKIFTVYLQYNFHYTSFLITICYNLIAQYLSMLYVQNLYCVLTNH